MLTRSVDRQPLWSDVPAGRCSVLRQAKLCASGLPDRDHGRVYNLTLRAVQAPFKGSVRSKCHRGNQRGHGAKSCPVEPPKRPVRVSQINRNVIAFLFFTKADRQSCAHHGVASSVRLILQSDKGEIEILHEAGIPTSQAARGA